MAEPRGGGAAGGGARAPVGQDRVRIEDGALVLDIEAGSDLGVREWKT